mmetsp:Transcript_22848/g.38105  ORF Transcript_22848/g.38105 Transcript_22848/m.38105 type:complete len:149 (-) Transcript_22848:1925-2371(-)
MKIRPIALSDLDAVQQMIGGLAMHHGDTPVPLSAATLTDLVSDTPWFTVLVAEATGGGLAGYAALLPTGQLQFGAKGMDIHHLFVRPDRRGEGAGQALVNACLSHARHEGCSYISVGTHPDNTSILGFYEAQGFERRTGFGPRFRRTL